MAITQQNETTLREKERKEVGKEAAEHIPGSNPLVGLRSKDLFQTFGMVTR